MHQAAIATKYSRNYLLKTFRQFVSKFLWKKIEMEVDEDSTKRISETGLVKYNIPILVKSHATKPVSHPSTSASAIQTALGSPRAKIGRPSTSQVHATAATIEKPCQTEEILDTILPPRTWQENGELWTQTVSSVPATRQDVVNLQETLDILLQQSQARETGICPVRRELYAQCFDEIIRQVTINCSERGLLLMRIRDEMVMSMDAYETLYCSSIAFGMRKALQSQEGKEKLVEYVAQLEADKDAMEAIISDMKLRAEQNDRRNAELHAAEEKKHAEEIAFLKKTNAQLKAQLEGIIAPKK